MSIVLLIKLSGQIPEENYAGISVRAKIIQNYIEEPQEYAWRNLRKKTSRGIPKELLRNASNCQEETYNIT